MTATKTGSAIEAHIDLPLFTESESIGVISGKVRFHDAPQTGDIVDFGIPMEGQMINNTSVPVLIKVISRTIYANADHAILLMLSDVIFSSRDHAKNVADLLVNKHGLVFDDHSYLYE